MTLVFHKLSAFVARDHVEASSYRFAFAMKSLRPLLTVLIFYFVSGLVGTAASPHLASYGESYFAFVLVGIAITEYFRNSLNDFSYAVRNAQVSGTIEALLVTQTGLPTIILASAVYGFITTSVTVILYFVAGASLFGVDLSRASVPAAALVLLFSIAAFSSIGIGAACLTVVFRRGDTVTSVFMQVSLVFGGVFYPVTVLPEWLQPAAGFLPITYALRAMRRALFQPEALTASLSDLAMLGVFSAVALPASMWAFSRAVHHAKVSGSLGHY
jgi:ABC-2 type transport system permease protein